MDGSGRSKTPKDRCGCRKSDEEINSFVRLPLKWKCQVALN